MKRVRLRNTDGSETERDIPETRFGYEIIVDYATKRAYLSRAHADPDVSKKPHLYEQSSSVCFI